MTTPATTPGLLTLPATFADLLADCYAALLQRRALRLAAEAQARPAPESTAGPSASAEDSPRLRPSA